MKASVKRQTLTMRITGRSEVVAFKTVKLATDDTVSILELPAWNLDEWGKGNRRRLYGACENTADA